MSQSQCCDNVGALTSVAVEPEMRKQVSSRKKAVDEALDTTSWLTRCEVADVLGVSTSTVGNLERSGRLHPRRIRRKNVRGRDHHMSVYDPQELPGLPQWVRRRVPRDPGETAARCFELLEQGQTPREIVVELRETPDVVSGLRERWLDMGGADLVLTREARSELEDMLGHFATVAELVDQVKKRAQLDVAALVTHASSNVVLDSRGPTQEAPEHGEGRIAEREARR